MSEIGGSMKQKYMRTLLAVCVVGCGVTLTGCASWTGDRPARIDEEIGQVNFAEVSPIVCDEKRGVSIVGSATPVRTLAVRGSDNAQAVLDLLLEAGFTPDEDFRDVDEFTRLNQNGVVVDVRAVTGEGRPIGNESCETPPEGAVEIRASI